MKKKAVECLKFALELQREIVGIQLLHTEKELFESPFCFIEGKKSVCGMVKMAQEGSCVKAGAKNFGCEAGGRALGILKENEPEIEKGILAESGLYKNKKISEDIVDGAYGCPACAGALFAPLIKMKEADVVILIVNARQAMRIMQGYAWFYGIPKSISAVGNQAVCMELIAKPYVCRDMNVSFLCRGTRTNLQAFDEELGIAIPITKFDKVAEGVARTFSVVENEKKKREMKSKHNAEKILGCDIELNTSYMQRMAEAEEKFFG